MASNLDFFSGAGRAVRLNTREPAPGLHVLHTETPAAEMATSQATVGTIATRIVSFRRHRREVVVTNHGTTAVYLGPPGVTAATGVLLPGTVGATVKLTSRTAVYGVVATGTAVVSAADYFPPTVRADYLGPVASTWGSPTAATSAGSGPAMVRSRHRAAQEISTSTFLQLLFPNYFVSGTEQGTGGAVNVTASIEYPSGTIIGRVSFGGASTGSIPDNGTLLSDACVLNGVIPEGAYFFVRFFMDPGAGRVAYHFNTQDTANGESWAQSTTTTDTTGIGGTFATTLAAGMSRPLAILGFTNRPTVAIIGDSRTQGIKDSHANADTSGDLGEVARSLGAAGLAYVGLGVSGDLGSGFVASHANRLPPALYCTHVVVEYGVNDIFSGAQTDAAVRATLNTIRGYFPATTKVYLTTMPPETTSTDAWATSGNQTTVNATREGVRSTNNTWRRTVPSGFAACFDVASVVEDASNPGKWKSDGTTANLYTSDGIHETQFANLAIQASGVVNTDYINVS